MFTIYRRDTAALPRGFDRACINIGVKSGGIRELSWRERGKERELIRILVSRSVWTRGVAWTHIASRKNR